MHGHVNVKFVRTFVFKIQLIKNETVSKIFLITVSLKDCPL